MNKKIKIAAVILEVTGILSCGYFVLLQILSPGTFLTAITSFSMIWLLPGLFCITLGTFQFKKSQLVWFYLSKRSRIIISGCAAGCVCIASVCLYFILTPRLADNDVQINYLIVLGGGITKNNTLGDVPQARIEKAAEYMKAHPGTKAVVTGGTGRFASGPEGPVLEKALASCGIAEDRILVEDQAKDTIQNFQYSAKLIAQDSSTGIKQVLQNPVAVITSDFHLARSERLAARMGFTDVYGIASKTPVLFILNSFAREIASYIQLNFRIILTGKPEKIV